MKMYRNFTKFTSVLSKQILKRNFASSGTFQIVFSCTSSRFVTSEVSVTWKETLLRHYFILVQRLDSFIRAQVGELYGRSSPRGCTNFLHWKTIPLYDDIHQTLVEVRCFPETVIEEPLVFSKFNNVFRFFKK